MQAVLNPASARPKAARRPAPPAPLQWENETDPNIEVEACLHYDSIEFMLDEWIFAGRPRLKKEKVRFFVDNEQLICSTLTSSALRGLAATTLDTDADE